MPDTCFSFRVWLQKTRERGAQRDGRARKYRLYCVSERGEAGANGFRTSKGQEILSSSEA